MAGNLPTSEPPTSNISLIPTILTAISAVPANTLVLENLENQRKSYLDFDMDELILTGLSSLLFLLGLKFKGKINY